MTNLFNKAALFTDIHWGLRSNSHQHNMDCLEFVNWFVSVAKKEKCDTCLFLGDWHHNRATINIETLHYSLSGLEILSKNFDQIFFIPGNHDLFYKNKRDIHSVEWAKHLPNITIINDWFVKNDVVIAPWLIGEEWKRLKTMNGKYLFGHFELPYFMMNAQIEMPDHHELQSEHLVGFEKAFSGHFHKRQQKNNVHYIGNAFPHNYSDSGDDLRGMMILEWDTDPKFLSWPDQPKFRTYNLSSVLNEPDQLLSKNMNVRINIDIDINYEESAYIRETLSSNYGLRETTLIPIKIDLEQDITDYSNLKFESVDSIIISQIEQLQQGSFDTQLLLSIYRSL